MSQEEQPIPKNKQELLERIQRSRQALERAFSTFGPEELEETLSGGWSIKDHLAHLASWEIGVAELLRRRPRFAAMGVEEAAQRDLGEEALNEVIFQRYAGMTVSEVMIFFHEAHQQMLTALAELKDEDLFRPYADFVSGEAGGDPSQNPVINVIIGNTYGHFDEHRDYIKNG
jgi:hypothetical protein